MDRVKTYTINEQGLPLVMEPVNESDGLPEILAFLREKQGEFRGLLLRHGGVLLRNFPFNDVDAFVAVIETLGLGEFLDYIGGDSPRKKIKAGVYTSTEAPPSFKIPLHNELSFVKKYPKHIYFYCETPPEKEGETIIADARQVAKSMDKGVKERFAQKKVRYRSCYHDENLLMKLLNPSHKPWSTVFETTSREEVEAKCREAEFDYAWHKNWIRIEQTGPGLSRHPQTGEEVWFNQAHLFDFNPRLLGTWKYVAAKAFYCLPHTRLHEVRYADGTPISREDLYSVMDTLDDNTIYFPWQKRDVLVLDNMLAMHGRAPFTGKRRILAAMT